MGKFYMMKINIRFNIPSTVGNEELYMAKAISEGRISGDNYFTRQCQDLLEKELGVQKILLTTSCTHALEMSAILLDLKSDDEIIVPSFTFVSTPNAFVLHGARPVFIDIHPNIEAHRIISEAIVDKVHSLESE